MALSRRQFSAEFKLRVVRQVEAGTSTAAVARRYEVHPTLLTKWRLQLRQDPERAFRAHRNGPDAEARIAEWERMIDQLTMEKALLKKALAQLEEQRSSSVAPATRR